MGQRNAYIQHLLTVRFLQQPKLKGSTGQALEEASSQHPRNHEFSSIRGKELHPPI